MGKPDGVFNQQSPTPDRHYVEWDAYDAPLAPGEVPAEPAEEPEQAPSDPASAPAERGDKPAEDRNFMAHTDVEL